MAIQWEQSENATEAPRDAKGGPRKPSQPSTGFKIPPLKKLILPIAFGSLAALVQCSLFSGRSPISVIRPSVGILVSQKKIPRGTAIEEAKIEVLNVPDDLLADQFLTEADLQKAKGRRFVMSIGEGQAIPKSFLLTEFQEKSVPEKIPPGKRLFVFETRLGELGSLLKPTDHVDVVADMNIPGFGATTLTLLENITIVGIGTDIDGSQSTDKNKSDSISLYATPQEAEYLTFAKKYGEFTVVLRNPMDGSAAKRNAGMTVNQFLESPRIRGVRENDIFEIIKGRKLK